MNVIHKGSEMAEILGSDNVHVLERGRETRPTAPVLCDPAEDIHNSDEIHNAIAKVEGRPQTGNTSVRPGSSP